MSKLAETKQQHESFGLLQISRGSSSEGIPLFGSSIRHRNLITLTISSGIIHRDLSNDWYSTDKHLVEVVMSPTQFAEAITTLNHGVGVPVTLSRVMGKEMAECPYTSKREQFNQEFEEHMVEAAKVVDDSIRKAGALLDGASKGKIKELISELESLKRNLSKNMPFVREQFTEQIDKTVMEAKGEVEAFVTHLQMKLGGEAIRKQLPEIQS
jgi:hypothetical protein